MADPQYMSRQTEITWKMRGILVDWIIEVHGKFRLLPETIFLAVNILDRLMSIRTVALHKFQLCGIVSLFIAAKYEEVVCPSVQSFLYMTDGGYTDEEMLSAERYVLKQIDFNLSYPNPINFLRRISKADGYDIQTRTVAKYFLEMTCVERKFISAPPSLIAAAGMWLARKVLKRGEWDCNLVHYSTYSQAELLPTAQLMLDYVLRKGQSGVAPGVQEHPHFYKKYTSKKFFRAADLVLKWAEDTYLTKKGSERGALGASGGVVNLFGALDNAGRLEEWEDEGAAVSLAEYV